MPEILAQAVGKIVAENKGVVTGVEKVGFAAEKDVNLAADATVLWVEPKGSNVQSGQASKCLVMCKYVIAEHGLHTHIYIYMYVRMYTATVLVRAYISISLSAYSYKYDINSNA